MRVTIETSRMERGLFRDEHDVLDADLEASGLRVVRPKVIEQRGYPGGVEPHEILSAVRITLEAVGDLALVVATVKRILRGSTPRGRKRTVEIYGPVGEVLSTVEIETGEAAEP